MKREGFEDGLLEYGSAMKRGYAYIVSNTGKIIAAITALIAVLVTFTDIRFFGIGAAEFTSTLTVLLISSYIIYFSLEDAGERLGEGNEEYKATLEKYNKIRARITPEMIPALRSFCAEYSAAELEYRRRSLLCSFGYSEEEYKASSEGGADRRSKRAFKAARRLRAVDLTPSMLISQARVSGGELTNPERTKLLRLTLKLLPSTLCMLLTASVILTAKADLDASALADGLLKLATLPIVGFRGYESGYSYTVGAKRGWIETKCRLLECFLAKGDSALTE